MSTPSTSVVALSAIVAFAGCAVFQHPPSHDAALLRSVMALDTVSGTVTLPMYRGRIRDTLVWYVVTESSDRDDAHRRGVTWSPKLALLGGTRAAQYGQITDGMLGYSAGVDFSPQRVLRPARDSGFPPAEAHAGSVGRAGYSPFVLLRGGEVLNAPIIASEIGVHDRVVSMDVAHERVTMRMSRGYANDRHAWYISTEASDETVAAFERATWVPTLASAPTEARSGLLAIVNGVTDRASPDRQGLQSAVLADLSPLNVLQHAPDPAEKDLDYSPLWDLHMASWTFSAIASNQREKVFTFQEAVSFARRGLLVSSRMGAPNTALGRIQAAGVAINCPIFQTFARSGP